jgi:hypothetical protein
LCLDKGFDNPSGRDAAELHGYAVTVRPPVAKADVTAALRSDALPAAGFVYSNPGFGVGGPPLTGSGFSATVLPSYGGPIFRGGFGGGCAGGACGRR